MKNLNDLDYAYAILTAVTSGLSVIGGLCICFLFYLFKDIRTPGRKLLMFLALADVATALGNLLGVVWYFYRDSPLINKNMDYCKFQSAWTIYFSIVSFAWTVIMGVCLQQSVIMQNPGFSPTYMKLFHIVSWIPPGIIVIVALSMNVLGYDQALDQASWCWIDPRVPNALFWQFLTGKFWEILAYITTVILYLMVTCYLWKRSKPGDRQGTRKSRTAVIHEANKKLTFVPLVFIVLRIWGTLRFLLGSFAHEYANSTAGNWIVPLQGVGDSAQGFANFVFYCISTEKIRRRLLSMCIPSKRRQETATPELQSRSVKKSAVCISSLSDINRTKAEQH
ncbi:hypothetical protein ACJMK2_043080 [Sinanodonta woodiana]|uniref:G-protein coupled receptors family 2 profile 2 domain-containing protein n=1 Tax=Sinanodonta woodiana TaxID=1069815 RepID=A0ABD3VZF6_SINWO